MSFWLIGIDYKKTPDKIRQGAYRLRRDIVNYWKNVNPGGAAVLFTCNRIEIYGRVSDAQEAAEGINAFRSIFFRYFKDSYTYIGHEDVLRHGLRLACGLESRLKGEKEILKQLDAWYADKDFPEPLKDLWGYILESAREIRQEAGLDKNCINVAFLVFSDLRRHVDSLKKPKILVIGTGKVAELVAEKRPHRAHIFFAARKKKAKAQALALKAGGRILSPEKIPGHLTDADVVISATSSPHYVLTLDKVKEVLKTRRQPLYIYDLAVPQDVSPDVGALSFVILKDLNSLTGGRHLYNEAMLKQLELAGNLVEDRLNKYKEPGHECADWYKAEPACAQAG